MAPAHEGRTASNLDKFPWHKQPKSQKGRASVMDRPAHAACGVARDRKTHLTVTNLNAVSKANSENNVTKNISPSGPLRNSAASQRKIEIESGFSTPQRTLTPQSSCTDLESASSHESSLHDVEPQVERQVLPSWLQPAHGKTEVGGVRALLRQRGQEIAVTSSNCQDNFTRTNLRARGNAVLAGVRAGVWRHDAMIVPAPLERRCAQAVVAQRNDCMHFMQLQATSLCSPAMWQPELAEQAPMKVDLTSLTSPPGISFPPGLEPPPGLEKPSVMPL